MKFVNIGFGNTVCAERIIAVVSPESAPAKRMVAVGRENGNIIDASCGRKTRSILVSDCGSIILSALQCETVSARLNGAEAQSEENSLA